MLQYYRFRDALNLFNSGKMEDGRRVLRELQSEYISMADELSELRAQVQEYEDILYLARNLVFDGSCYWLLTGSLRQGPFCRHGVFPCPNCSRDTRMDETPDNAADAKPRKAHAKVIPFGH